MGVSPFVFFFSLDDWAVFRSVPLEVVLAPLALGICTAAGEKVSALGIIMESKQSGVLWKGEWRVLA